MAGVEFGLFCLVSLAIVRTFTEVLKPKFILLAHTRSLLSADSFADTSLETSSAIDGDFIDGLR